MDIVYSLAFISARFSRATLSLTDETKVEEESLDFTFLAPKSSESFLEKSPRHMKWDSKIRVRSMPKGRLEGSDMTSVIAKMMKDERCTLTPETSLWRAKISIKQANTGFINNHGHIEDISPTLKLKKIFDVAIKRGENIKSHNHRSHHEAYLEMKHRDRRNQIIRILRIDKDGRRSLAFVLVARAFTSNGGGGKRGFRYFRWKLREKE
ncbi:hypothetical protein H5410_041908 [Solanum commersonii]|uniref:Uncharacterized protein n=1 Tax=Solanum commersonii TaxID=4109 RepID=A0A9J5XUI0_SOLCO|nr:hypothetical protein H5410_041908 [Solanum commersonii]